jgi:hypothetical protein
MLSGGPITMQWEGAERRRHARKKIFCKLFSFVGAPHILSSFTEDISESGLRAVFDERLPLDAVVGLEIYLHDYPFICKGRIVWVKEIPNPDDPQHMNYDTGIEFLNQPTSTSSA